VELRRRYEEIRGGLGQYVHVLAVAAGLKPCIDDWVGANRLDDYLALLADLGLTWVLDCWFDGIEDPGQVVGSDHLTTTVAGGVAPEMPAPPHAEAHVFVARSRDQAAVAQASGRYPVVANGRVLPKPWIDHIRFGQALGYPVCCVKSFARHSRWHADNPLWHAFLGSASPSILANSLPKHQGRSWMMHLPCSWSCEATMSQSRRLREHVREVDIDLADAVDQACTGTFLVLNELEAYRLAGARPAGERTAYVRAELLPSTRPTHPLRRLMAQGDHVEVDLACVRVYQGTEFLGAHEARCDTLGPEMAHLVRFSGDSDG